jgi:hypothetical protein
MTSSNSNDSNTTTTLRERLKNNLSYISMAFIAIAALIIGTDSVEDPKAILIGLGTLLVFSIGIRRFQIPSRLGAKGILVMLVILLTIVTVAVILYTNRIEATKTTYFVIDTSTNMRGRFQLIVDAVKNNTYDVRDTDEIGLMFFGGNTEPSSNCEDAVRAFSVPQIKKEAEKSILRVSERLNQIIPTSLVPLQEAIESAIKELKGRPGLQHIVIFTSGDYGECDSLNAEAIEKIARENSVEYFLVLLVTLEPGGKDLSLDKQDELETFVAGLGGQGTFDIIPADNSSIDVSSRVNVLLGQQPIIYPINASS